MQQFATTHWSLVLAAGRGSSVGARDALAALCRSYWYPLYAFVRRRGYGPEDAQDLTQAFFARLLEKGYLRAADSERGRFRSFLVTACQHFLAKEQNRARAKKRGGGRKVLTLDFDAGERRYRREPAHSTTPEVIYERQWALTLLNQVLQQLEQEYATVDKQHVFNQLKDFLTGEQGTAYRDVALSLGLSEGAVKVAVHRLRRRYRELLRAAITQTVATPEDVEDELRHLFSAVRPEKRSGV
jgi:RNA polymerase sigma factor (sigma-70 family)